MNTKPIIGILAGMGPKSTAPFVEKVIDECQKQYGAQNDIDFPHILVYSLPTPFFVNKPIDHVEMKKTLIGGIKKLEQAGVAFIAIPCNTVHIYFDELQKATKVPLLNIIKESVEEIPQGAKKVTFFATRATVASSLYQKELERKKIHYVLKKEWQEQVDKMISSVKKGDVKEALKEMKLLSKKLNSEKIDCILVACTDLQPIIKQIKTMVVVDSSSTLAKAVVKKYITS